MAWMERVERTCPLGDAVADFPGADVVNAVERRAADQPLERGPASPPMLLRYRCDRAR